MPPDDPAQPSRPRTDLARDHLANERTFLAWVRTALGLIGLGFVLARMGLFLRQVTAVGGLIREGHRLRLPPGHEFLVSGVVFLLVGIAFCAWSARRYGENRRAIDSGRYLPAEGSVLALTGLVVIGGLIIAAMVVWRTLFTAET